MFRQGLPLATRYDRKNPVSWGNRVFFEAYDIAVDGKVVLSYDDLRQDRLLARHIAQTAMTCSFLAVLILAGMAFRAPPGRIYGMPPAKKPGETVRD